MLVFQLSKQQNRTRTTLSTVLGTPRNRTRIKRCSLEELRGRCFVSWVPRRESTENGHFRSLKPSAKPHLDTSWVFLLWCTLVYIVWSWEQTKASSHFSNLASGQFCRVSCGGQLKSACLPSSVDMLEPPMTAVCASSLFYLAALSPSFCPLLLHSALFSFILPSSPSFSQQNQ